MAKQPEPKPKPKPKKEPPAVWPFPTVLPTSKPIVKLPFNASNFEDSPL